MHLQKVGCSSRIAAAALKADRNAVQLGHRACKVIKTSCKLNTLLYVMKVEKKNMLSDSSCFLSGLVGLQANQMLLLGNVPDRSHRTPENSCISGVTTEVNLCGGPVLRQFHYKEMKLG